MSFKGLFLAWIITVCISPFSKAITQDSVKDLSIDEAINAALANNKDVQLAELDENISKANYRLTNAVFLPQASLSYTAMNTNNPLNAFGFKLQQGVITQNDFDPSKLNNPEATTDYVAKLEVQQPLVNVDLLYQRRGAKRQTEVYQYKTERTKEYLTFEVRQAYLQLQLAYAAEQVLEGALQTATTVYTYTDNHFKQGLIQKSDLLNAAVQKATVQSNLSKAKSNIGNISDQLSLLMGEKPGIIYRMSGNYDQQITDALKNVSPLRADLMALQKAVEASDLMVRSAQMGYLPKLNAFGDYQYNDSRLTGFGANAYLAGVRLSWDIFKGNRTRNMVASQKLERDKLVTQLTQQKEQSQTTLNKAYRDMEDANFEAEQEQVAVQQATESLRILQNRYQQGLVSTTDILMAENQLAQQKLSLAQAQFTLNITGAYIQFLTSTTNK